jgi:hypothetical protein
MKRKLQTYSLVIFALIGLNFSFSLFAQSEYQSKLSILDEYYAKALSDWKVPGMAIAIVKDGEIIYAKGFGVKDVRTKEPVDSETLFPIASNTKAFTSAALAILVDRGLISWSDKVTDYLPYFKLWDPYVTENITISDLLTHRAGLATFSGDLLWYGTLYSREEIIKRARHLKPAFGFRERFGYSNLESVPLDTTQYVYDSLCPHTIQSGTIDLTDCLVIQSIDELPSPDEYYESIRWIPVKAYPNPVSGQELTIEFENTQHHSNIELRLYDAFGKEVHRRRIYTGQQDISLDVGHWPPGLYLVVVYSNGGAVGQCKVVVE